MIIQIILSLFLTFAISRVILQVRSAKISVGAFLFWCGIFIFAITGVLEPGLTTYLAKILGIGRGSDVVLYLSIALLFYLIFRLSISLEETRREITKIVQIIALQNVKKKTKHARKK